MGVVSMEAKAVQSQQSRRRTTASSPLTSGRRLGLLSRKHGVVGMPIVDVHRAKLGAHLIHHISVMQLSSTGKLHGAMRTNSGAANTRAKQRRHAAIAAGCYNRSITRD